MSYFKILSIDGGGMKGIYSIAFLAALEEKTGKRVADYFDLIVGTSTGGIIGLGLSLGMTASNILDFYLDDGKNIFPSKNLILRVISGLVSTRYNEKNLLDALKKYFGTLRLGEAKTRLVIPSFNPVTGDVYLFKTAHDLNFSEDYKKYAWEVAYATSAAPTYFKAHKTGFYTHLIDGGMWANNPSMVGVSEAIGYLRENPENIAMLSIGTDNASASVGEKTAYQGGIIRWAWIISSRLFVQMQALTAHRQAGLLLRHGRYIRINPKLSETRIPLDDTKKARNLIPFGEQDARHHMKTIEEVFFSAIAKKFIPVYSIKV